MAMDNKGGSVGLYFTEETIVAVQARTAHKHVEIVAHGVIQAPPGAIVQGIIMDPAKLGTAIRALLRKAGISARSASVAIFSAGYTMRVLQMPDVPPKERRLLVRGELEASDALPVGSGTFDFIWSSTGAAAGNRQTEVYTYYTVDLMVENVRESLRSAGLQLSSMEPASLSIIRAQLAASSQRRPLAFLYASENYSDLCLHDGEKIQQIRRIPAGWGDYARETATPSLFGAAPLSGGLADEGPQPQGSVPLDGPPNNGEGMAGAVGAESEQAAQRTLNRPSSTTFLASEIARTLAFHAREFPNAPQPEAVIVLGISAIIPSFRAAMSGSLPLPLMDLMPNAFGVALPWEDPGGTAGAYLASMGAAIGTMEQAIPPLDISRQETLAKARQRAPIQLLSGMSIGTAWALASAAAAITLTVMQSADEQRIVQVRQELETVKQRRAPLIRGQQIVDAIQAARRRSEVPAGSVLGRVAASTTAGVELTGLQIGADGKVTVDGRAVDAASIQHFATLLSLGRSVQAPSFEMMRQDDKNRLQFRIAGVYSKAAEPAPQAQPAAPGTPPPGTGL